MIRPDPLGNIFYIGGRGSLKNVHYKIEKKVEFWGYYVVDLWVRNAYLYPI